MTKIAINELGRIGRAVFTLEQGTLELVAVKDFASEDQDRGQRRAIDRDGGMYGLEASNLEP